MRAEAISLDISNRRLVVDGQSKMLPNKCWLVLQLLTECSDQVVTRQALIDQVWHGNVYSGEKALTQTVWLLREALQDSAAESQFIRTHPGEGYQWVAAPNGFSAKRLWGSIPAWLRLPLPLRNVLTPAGGVLAVVATVIMAGVLWGGSLTESLESIDKSYNSVASDGSYAYQQGERVIVELADGRRAIIQPSYGKSFSHPALSDDGEQLALQVTESGRCALVVFEFATRQRKEFTGCFQANDVNQQRYL